MRPARRNAETSIRFGKRGANLEDSAASQITVGDGQDAITDR